MSAIISLTCSKIKAPKKLYYAFVGLEKAFDRGVECANPSVGNDRKYIMSIDGT